MTRQPTSMFIIHDCVPSEITLSTSIACRLERLLIVRRITHLVLSAHRTCFRVYRGGMRLEVIVDDYGIKSATLYKMPLDETWLLTSSLSLLPSCPLTIEALLSLTTVGSQSSYFSSSLIHPYTPPISTLIAPSHRLLKPLQHRHSRLHSPLSFIASSLATEIPFYLYLSIWVLHVRAAVRWSTQTRHSADSQAERGGRMHTSHCC